MKHSTCSTSVDWLLDSVIPHDQSAVDTALTLPIGLMMITGVIVDHLVVGQGVVINYRGFVAIVVGIDLGGGVVVKAVAVDVHGSVVHVVVCFHVAVGVIVRFGLVVM